jgi:vacuolar-type H+-ATPase subunit F/Vma7
MKTCVAVAIAFVGIGNFESAGVSACGDKFLLVGRGVRFQRAYAAIHPASILIVLPPKSVKSAAVRDSSLVTALKMAGHRVEVVQQPANLFDALGRSRHDLVLAERADASAIQEAAAGTGQQKPSIVAVLEQPSAAELTAARQQLEYVLKTPQSLLQILNLLDDVMKARVDRLRPALASGAYD